MAKRNRDGNAGRALSGGIRQTRGVRETVSRATRGSDPFASLGRYEVDLDLSAFEDADREIGTRFERAFDEIVRKRYAPAPQKRKQPEGRATEYTDRRKAPIKAERRDSRLSLAEGQAVTKQSARIDHLHAERSDKRKERSRPINCKQRPEPTKGGGSSRKFVPWCDRKR